MSAAFIEPVRLNKFWLGFLLGIGFPALFFLLFFLFRFRDLTLDQYFKSLVQGNSLVHIISLAVSSNLIPFVLFVRTNRFKAGKGVVGVTILYVIFLFVLKVSI